MGYTKIFAIRQRLDKTVAYATNEEKTRLDKLVDYAADPKKTKMRLYESCINCKNVDNGRGLCALSAHIHICRPKPPPQAVSLSRAPVPAWSRRA